LGRLFFGVPLVSIPFKLVPSGAFFLMAGSYKQSMENVNTKREIEKL